MSAPSKARRHRPRPPEPYAPRAKRTLIPHVEAREALRAELLSIPGFRAIAERIAKDHGR